MQKKKVSKKKHRSGCTGCGRCKVLEQRFKAAKKALIGDFETADLKEIYR